MKSFRQFVTLREETTIGDPTPNHYRRMQKSHEVLPVDSNVELLSKPPSDDSEETRVELMELQDRSELTKDRNEIMEKWDKDISKPFIEYMDKHNLEYNLNDIERLMEQSNTIVLKQKYLYARPRPFILAKNLGLSSYSINTNTTKSPSYPSGHSTQSRLLAMYLAERHRRHSEALLNMAEECGESRLNAFLHYPSDHEAGQYLANLLWESCTLRGKIND